MHDLIPFQARFVKKALAPETMTAALSMPRGNGKSWLAARICADAMKELQPEQEIALVRRQHRAGPNRVQVHAGDARRDGIPLS